MMDVEMVESSTGESGTKQAVPASKGLAGTYELPWVEKYRPLKLNEMKKQSAALNPINCCPNHEGDPKMDVRGIVWTEHRPVGIYGIAHSFGRYPSWQ